MYIFFQNNQYLGSYYLTGSDDDPVYTGQGVFEKVLHSYMHSIFEATHNTHNLDFDMGLDRLGTEFFSTCFIFIHIFVCEADL